MSKIPETYLHGHHESVLRSHTWRTAQNSAAYLLANLTPGTSVLDVGCGPGTITADFARLVGDGRVVGLEPVPGPLEQARANAEGLENATFEAGDVYDLPYADGEFDVVHAHQVLQHLTDPVAALREMARVCAPDGVVAVRDADYGAMTWFPDEPRLQRWQAIYRQTARAIGAEPDAGRRLKSWALQAGLTEIETTASVWCYASPDEVSWWSGLWADRILHSNFHEQALAITDEAELEELSTAFRRWGEQPDAWFLVPHGEVLARPAAYSPQ
ncbi:methyltransferase domain-containing protein [Epidermidibacterium keratini]|uniref:Methyltransferase domain-containing protein n=1 Tax=Epidermidibacterium keratini TaxID=1891644 RepID=A0A7L4YKV7_9ACTN|nr:methyltransferase domain-containing protein [Epidermidibacterium keratini]QHB99825.1 methyltransferase domain-containing protein [Epidermidibacterium keratini]